MSDIFENFSWHSSIGIDESMNGNKSFRTKLPNTVATRRHFIASSKGDNFLVHKTTKSLWRMSEDNKSIEALFPTDILSEDEAKEIMEENEE
jgi:hypothetical protein